MSGDIEELKDGRWKFESTENHQHKPPSTIFQLFARLFIKQKLLFSVLKGYPVFTITCYGEYRSGLHVVDSGGCQLVCELRDAFVV